MLSWGIQLEGETPVSWGLRSLRATAVLILGTVLAGAGPAPKPGDGKPPGDLPRPRELSEAERAAVGLAAD
jgi:hypothetical protein